MHGRRKKIQTELDAEAVESGVSPGSGAQSAETADAPPIKVPREGEEEIPDRNPYVVVIIDELADSCKPRPRM
jgi:hypothetical protein